MPLTTVTIETPANSRVKYHYDLKADSFSVKKILPLGMVFPFDFGFIAGTTGEDGDPLDAMVIAEFQTFPGCRINCRLIGMLQAIQKEAGKPIRNDRYFFIPDDSLVYRHIKTIGHLPAQIIKELLVFFVNYNKLEGKKFTPLKVVGAVQSRRMLKKQAPRKEKL